MAKLTEPQRWVLQRLAQGHTLREERLRGTMTYRGIGTVRVADPTMLVLERGGYLEVSKRSYGQISVTEYTISAAGREALLHPQRR